MAVGHICQWRTENGGQVRLLEIPEIYQQPGDGAYVARISTVGPFHVARIENKGKRNQRANIVFEE